MAGLQYNLFPTDFFYPRPIPAAGQTPSSLPMLQIQKRTEGAVSAADHDDVKHKSSLVIRNKNSAAAAAAVVNKRM
ncbi:hypothetical protein LINPERHAP2_LOCUS30682 [Linum perenne]